MVFQKTSVFQRKVVISRICCAESGTGQILTILFF